jgi:hypothetical protein
MAKKKESSQTKKRNDRVDPRSVDTVDGGGPEQYVEVEEAGWEEEDVEMDREPEKQLPRDAPQASHNSDNITQLSKSKIFLALAALLFLVFTVGFCGGLAGSVVMINNREEDQSGTMAEQTAAPSEQEGDDSSSSDSSDDVATPAPSPNASTITPTIQQTVPPTPMTKQEIQSFLASVVPDQGTTFSDSTSPQSQAVDWLYLDMLSSSRQYPESQMMQRYVLALLYYSTSGEGWDNQLNFLSDDPECEWGFADGYIPTMYGYMDSLPVPPCDDESNMLALSIQRNDLLGTIPEELVLLTHLRFLSLRDNPLSGTIPTHLGRLTNLQLLGIIDCQVTGPIPTEFGRFRLLDFLDLTGNNLSGTIPTEFGQLTSLAGLWIHGNHRIRGNVPEQLGSMQSVGKNYYIILYYIMNV